MKKIVLLMLLFISGSVMMFAHEDDSVKKEKMYREVLEFKMKYMAQEMQLSESQKEKFFDLYEEMSEEKRECYEGAIKLDRKIKHEKNANDQEYQKVTEAFNKANQKWAEEEKEYNEKFAEFLTPKQMYKMKEAEQSFRSKLDEMRHNRKKEHSKKRDGKK